MMPFAANSSMEAMTASFDSPRPMWILVKTWLRPKTVTACSRAFLMSSSASPGKTYINNDLVDDFRASS